MKQFWRFPILCAAAAVLVVAAVDWAVIPLNEAGRCQWATGCLAGFSRLLQLPGLMAAQKLRMPVTHRPELATWCLMMAGNVPAYLLAAVIGRRMWRLGLGCPTLDRLVPNAHRAVSPAPRPLQMSSAQPILRTRRQFLAAGNQLALCGAAATLGYSFAIERERFIVTRHAIPIRGLPSSLRGLTIAHLTDIHHGPWTSLAYVRRVVDATNALNADLIALTGDYILYSSSYVRPAVTELARLRARIGVAGVLGNHDWFEGGPLTQSEFRRAGIPLIDNSRRFISADRLWSARAPKTGLCVAGLADLWGGKPDYSKALGGVPHEMPRLLLSHNPDTAELQVARDRRHRVDLMLSGHTHGGQIWVPGFGSPIIPSSYGQKYARGLVRGPSFPVFVSSGLGTTVVPLRFCRPPEIALITLECDG